MSKFLFVSKEGAIPDLACTVRNEGHKVRMTIEDPLEQEVGNGFVDKIPWDQWRDLAAEWADVIIFDYDGYGEDADRLRAEGRSVVGGTPYTDRLESDRDYAQDQLREVGFDTLHKWSFKSYDEAIEDLKKKPRRVVVKPSGSAQSEKVLTYVGEHDKGSDVIALLSKLKEGWKDQIQSFQLQEHAAGVEVAVGAFFNGRRFILPACVNFEHKRMFAGDVGPTTGEMGTLCYWDSESRLVVKGLKPMEKKLIEVGYRGYFDINFIATEDRLRPLEFTPRFGYPTINLQIEALTSPWGKLLLGLARGENVTLRPKPGFQLAVVVAVPPFPFKDEEAFKKYSKDAVVLFKGDQNGVHPNDVKLVNKDWILTGTAGYAVVVTGSGDTVEQARTQVYERIRNLVIPNMFYRTDIGDRWRRDADLLYSWGYLTPP